jgi:hypothetical protein
MDEQKPEKKRKSLGCVTLLLVLGIALLAAGVWLMQGWNQAGAPSRTGAIVLVVVGALFLVPAVIGLVVILVVRHFVGKMTKAIEEIGEGLTGSAKDIIELNERMYGAIHEFRPATDADFEGLDRSYYDEVTTELTGRGFRLLGDLVDTAIEQQQNVHPPIRVFTAEGGTTQVGIYHFVPAVEVPMADGKSLKMREAITELSDGSFLLTSNTLGSDLMTGPPRLRKEQLELAIPLAELLDCHEQRKVELLQQSPGLTCVAIHTLEEAIASEKRQQQVKNEFRQSIGYADPEEVRRIGKAGVEGDADVEAFADGVADAVKNLKPNRKEPQ